MSGWTKRIRASVVMGLLWAGAFAVAGGIAARLPGLYSDVPFAILFAPLGFGSGVIFSGILVALARRHRLHRLSLPRFATWGAGSGLLFSSVLVGGAALRGEVLHASAAVFVAALSTAGALCASGSLALARRGAGNVLEVDIGNSSELLDGGE